MYDAHRLFHDAESVFWVLVWVLVRSASSNYSPGPEEWTQELRNLVLAMETHEPGRLGLDHRRHIVSLVKGEWEDVLHPDLKGMAPMLAAMSSYIQPEWAYRPELDADHVQEALMRLLLTEIVRINDSEGGDIELVVGIRTLPG